MMKPRKQEPVVNEQKQPMETKGVKLGKFLERNQSIAIGIIGYLIVVIAFSSTATATVSADALWSTVAGLIETWVTRLGAVVMFVGGVMFGLGWKNEDAEQKSRGVSTLISGAIVVAVAALTSQFFA